MHDIASWRSGRQGGIGLRANRRRPGPQPMRPRDPRNRPRKNVSVPQAVLRAKSLRRRAKHLQAPQDPADVRRRAFGREVDGVAAHAGAPELPSGGARIEATSPRPVASRRPMVPPYGDRASDLVSRKTTRPQERSTPSSPSRPNDRGVPAMPRSADGGDADWRALSFDEGAHHEQNWCCRMRPRAMCGRYIGLRRSVWPRANAG